MLGGAFALVGLGGSPAKWIIGCSGGDNNDCSNAGQTKVWESLRELLPGHQDAELALAGPDPELALAPPAPLDLVLLLGWQDAELVPARQDLAPALARQGMGLAKDVELVVVGQDVGLSPARRNPAPSGWSLHAGSLLNAGNKQVPFPLLEGLPMQQLVPSIWQLATPVSMSLSNCQLLGCRCSSECA